MKTRKHQYYSSRVGSLAGQRHSLEELKDYFRYIYERLRDDGFFQEAFGYYCYDQGYVPGLLGENIHMEVSLQVGKKHLWPAESQDFVETINSYIEEDLFDMVEFLFQQVSKPNKEGAWFHEYAGCGWHYREFFKEPGEVRFQQEINELLSNYGPGYRLSEKGEIEEIGDFGLDTLLDAPVPDSTPVTVQERISLAVRKYRKYNADIQDKRIAIKELVDVLEYLRPELKGTLKSKDEQDLFNIANNFGIRHHRQNQKTDYDLDIWYRWMFYYYLATIHASLRLIGRAKEQEGKR